MLEVKERINNSIKKFNEGSIINNSMELFSNLNYKTDLKINYSCNSTEAFIKEFKDEENKIKEENLLSEEWVKFSILFQLDKTSLTDQVSLELDNDNFLEKYESYIFSVLELKGDNYSKTKLSKITREINKQFMMPVMILFKYSDKITFSIIDRRINKNDEQKDVLKKVTLIKDVNILNPHRAHIDILSKLNFDLIIEKNNVRSFPDFHKAFKEALSISELNNDFYKELSNWYFWARKNVVFPDGKENIPAKDNSVSVIRLITRMIFVWFMKEKNLIPQEIFDKKYISTLFDEKMYDESTYYKVILQNLFFATLNQEMNKRGFRNENRHQGKNEDYNNTGVYRYKIYLKDPNDLLELFKDIPFLNGGLFECLDKEDKENIKIINRYDGFSDRPNNILCVPEELFFSNYKKVDLSEEYDDKNKKNEKVEGLINLFNKYVFTVDENTPLEEEIALDPELLGRVFENLLASYNPETKSSARKSTGSFYTPREVVQYMVDESLIYYLSNHLEKNKETKENIKKLVEYNELGNPFNDEETDKLIEAIYNIKILDPACGSGAFPMGALNKLVYILHELDPYNIKWKNKNLEKVELIDDSVIREEQRKNIIENFRNNELDYGRKLYLIEKCIYGVDIQPIAIQISKLRFFISLLVDQVVNKSDDNLGVKSLPNLETKFVVANTLVNIESEKRNFSFADHLIQQKKKELFKIRHEYFSVKKRKEKKRLIHKDEKIRNEIVDLLVEYNWGKEYADEFSKWDPYDINNSANFLNTEWMFGLKQGFDIVIGNPPYIDSEEMKKNLNELREYCKEKYKFAKGNWDIYIIFFEVALNMLNQNGILAFITPDKWISKSYGITMRENIIRNITSIMKGGRDVFETVNVDAIITLISKIESDIINVFEYDTEIKYKRTIDKRIIDSPFNLDIVFSENIDIIKKLSENTKLVDYGFICENACATSDAYKLKSLILNKNNFDDDKYLKIINTGTISKFNSLWGIRDMTYLKDKYKYPVVEKKEFKKKFNEYYVNKSTSRKIIIKGLTLLDACIDIDGITIPGKSTLIIRSEKLDELKILLGIVNSNVSIFYIKEKYSSSSYNGGINFNKIMINNLPYPNLNRAELIRMIELIDKIIKIKKKNTDDKTAIKLQKQINEILYEGYNLTKKDIEIIEKT